MKIADPLRNPSGVTLIELLTVIGIIGVLVLLAMPQFSSYIRNASYREAATELTQVMKQARNLAITRNREIRLEMDLATQQGQLIAGDRANKSSWCDDPNKTWTAPGNGAAPQCTRTPLWTFDSSNAVRVGRGIDGNTAGDPTDDTCVFSNLGMMIFGPKGTVGDGADFDFLCVADTAGAIKYYVFLSSPTTGRVQTGKPSDWP